LLRRFIVFAFALFTLAGVFAVPAGAATGGPSSQNSTSSALLAGNVNNGPLHQVRTEKLPATECAALHKTAPKASCAFTVTIDVRKVTGPQKPPAGARVAATGAPAATASSYWNYEVGTVTSRGAIWHATLQEEVAYHNNCPNADCTNQGVVWNQWEDISGFACVTGCTISDRADGVINNGKTLGPAGYLNGWENFTTNCNVSISGNSAGCNAGHGNRLYFRADGYWWGSAF
jgi:hypothetical protein